jgi:predicted permease
MMRDLRQDLLHGLRLLRRNPLFGTVVIVTLALGIGANTAIFSLVDALLLRSLPVKDPERLVLLSAGSRGGRMLGLPLDDQGRLRIFSYRLYQMTRDAAPSRMIAAQDSNVEPSIVVGGPAGDGEAGRSAPEETTERSNGRCVTGNFFSLLGVSAQLGRVLGPGDETSAGADRVVVLSDGYWRRRFGADPRIVGARLTINGTSYTVVGVARAGFTGAETGSATDFWLPVTMGNEFTGLGLDLRNPSYWWLTVIGRLAPGETTAAAEASANAVLRRFLAEHPEVAPDGHTRDRARIRVEPAPGGTSDVRQTFRHALLVLMATVGLLLLVVCLNVSHLLLARAVGRRFELGVRAALGASRGRLLRQLATEALLLALLGAAAGLLVHRWFQDGLVALVAASRNDVPLALDVHTDARLVLFVVGVVLATATLLGAVPALGTLRGDLQTTLRSSTPSMAAGHRLTGRILLASQVASSLVLLVGAGLLTGTLARLRGVSSGYDEEHVLLAGLNVQKTGLDDARAQLLYRDLEARLLALPGVRGAGLGVPDLLSGSNLGWAITFPGTSRPRHGVQLALVTPGYLEAIGQHTVRGRGLASADDAGSPRVALVNQAMASHDFDGEPLGKLISLDGVHQVEIVGVISDAHSDGLRDGAPPTFYLPAAQPHGIPAQLRLSMLAVRGAGDVLALTAAVRGAVRAAMPGLPMTDVRTLRSQVDRSLTGERLLAALASAFGLAALFLVAVGLYGVISQWAAQRTREIGVRMAVGATSSGVRWLVLRQAFVLVAIGVAVGVPAALAAARLLTGLLYGVPPMHPPTVATAAVLLFAVAALAAYLPARRASRVDPMSALRCD